MPVTQRIAQIHRPRMTPGREVEIREHAVDLLIEVGYDKLTLDAVAARAHASKATLYRHWPGKLDLVLDSLVSTGIFAPKVTQDTGSLRDDLLSMCRPEHLDPRVMPVLGVILPALHRDADFHRRFVTEVLGPKRAVDLLPFERAQRRGEIGPDADLATIASIVPGIAVFRLFVEGQRPDPATFATLIETVVLPVCAATTHQPSQRHQEGTTDGHHGI